MESLIQSYLRTLQIEEIYKIPYKRVTSHSNTNNEYVYLYIYQIINGVHVVIKMLNSHIFMLYIPEADIETIQTLFKNREMEQLSKIIFEKYICVQSDHPYCELGMFYIETLSHKFSYTIKQNGHCNKLSEMDIFSLLNMYWKTYYSNDHYKLLRNPTSEMYNKYNTTLFTEHNPNITLFTSPYDYKKNIYINLQEFIQNQLKLNPDTMINANNTPVSASCVNCSIPSNIHGNDV